MVRFCTEAGKSGKLCKETIYSGCVWLSTAHDDCIVDAPASRKSHEKTELLPLIFYNKFSIGANVSDHILSCYCPKGSLQICGNTVLSPS